MAAMRQNFHLWTARIAQAPNLALASDGGSGCGREDLG